MNATTKQLCDEAVDRIAKCGDIFVREQGDSVTARRLAAAAFAKGMLVGGVTWMVHLFRPDMPETEFNQLLLDVLDFLNKRLNNVRTS